MTRQLTAAEEQALNLFYSMTVEPEQVFEWTRHGRNGKPYEYTKSNLFKGAKLLRKVGAGAPTGPGSGAANPAPPAPSALGRSWIFMAEQPDRAVTYPSYYGIAFTADSAYARPSAATLKTLRDRGQRVRSWCDCHSTFPVTAAQMARDLSLDGWIGEGESEPACQVAIDAGAELIIGNLSALNDRQKWHIRGGWVVWINELYLNQDASRADREDWMNLPVAGRCIAAYDARGEASTGRRFPVSEYLALGKFQAHRDSFYDPGSTDDDRRLLP